MRLPALITAAIATTGAVRYRSCGNIRSDRGLNATADDHHDAVFTTALEEAGSAHQLVSRSGDEKRAVDVYFHVLREGPNEEDGNIPQAKLENQVRARPGPAG